MIEFINPFNKALAYPGVPAAWNIETTSGLMRFRTRSSARPR